MTYASLCTFIEEPPRHVLIQHDVVPLQIELLDLLERLPGLLVVAGLQKHRPPSLPCMGVIVFVVWCTHTREHEREGTATRGRDGENSISGLAYVAWIAGQVILRGWGGGVGDGVCGSMSRK